MALLQNKGTENDQHTSELTRYDFKSQQSTVISHKLEKVGNSEHRSMASQVKKTQTSSQLGWGNTAVKNEELTPDFEASMLKWQRRVGRPRQEWDDEKEWDEEEDWEEEGKESCDVNEELNGDIDSIANTAVDEFANGQRPQRHPEEAPKEITGQTDLFTKYLEPQHDVGNDVAQQPEFNKVYESQDNVYFDMAKAQWNSEIPEFYSHTFARLSVPPSRSSFVSQSQSSISRPSSHVQHSDLSGKAFRSQSTLLTLKSGSGSSDLDEKKECCKTVLASMPSTNKNSEPIESTPSPPPSLKFHSFRFCTSGFMINQGKQLSSSTCFLPELDLQTASWMKKSGGFAIPFQHYQRFSSNDQTTISSSFICPSSRTISDPFRSKKFQTKHYTPPPNNVVLLCRKLKRKKRRIRAKKSKMLAICFHKSRKTPSLFRRCPCTCLCCMKRNKRRRKKQTKHTISSSSSLNETIPQAGTDDRNQSTGTQMPGNKLHKHKWTSKNRALNLTPRGDAAGNENVSSSSAIDKNVQISSNDWPKNKLAHEKDTRKLYTLAKNDTDNTPTSDTVRRVTTTGEVGMFLTAKSGSADSAVSYDDATVPNGKGWPSYCLKTFVDRGFSSEYGDKVRYVIPRMKFKTVGFTPELHLSTERF